eukprot:TRINITY_DN2896_c0_g1_i1.p1 TRINITY_DN2896_c0_g1~~TRINITY_DN2896_c0_g1_i1.p1  ORF type:complete len:113 (-),score=10.21 TRINITY_DN2896_c0_g1_i1:405-743(-)
MGSGRGCWGPGVEVPEVGHILLQPGLHKFGLVGGRRVLQECVRGPGGHRVHPGDDDRRTPLFLARMGMGVPGLALMDLLRPVTNVGVQIRSLLGLCSFLLDIPESSYFLVMS